MERKIGSDKLRAVPSHDRRLLATGRLAAAGLVLVLPLLAALVDPQFSPLVKGLIVCLAALTVAAPPLGLIAVVLLLPLSLAFEIILGPRPQTVALAECLVVAFAAGAWVRPRQAHREANDEEGWLGPPALVLGVVVMTSLVVQLSAMQAVAPARPVIQDLWIHLTKRYWSGQEFLVLHQAWRWLTVLAAAVAAERIVRLRPGWHTLFVKVWVFSGGVAACYAVARLAEVVGRLNQPMGQSVVWVLTNLRISALHPDPNAAGSLFLLYLVPAIVLGLAWRSIWVLGGVVPLVIVAFVLAQSRAAIIGLVAVLALIWLSRIRRLVTAIAVIATTVGVLLIAAALTAPSHVSASRAMELRLQMTEVGWRIVSRYPVFGVGLDGYVRASHRFTTPDQRQLVGFAPTGENAHNNFLQVMGELGVPALLILFWLVGPTALHMWPRPRGTPGGLVGSMAAGIVAFLITALAGHPLLVPQVAFGFFLCLGMTAGLARPPAWNRLWIRYATFAGAAFYLVSLSWRWR